MRTIMALSGIVGLTLSACTSVHYSGRAADWEPPVEEAFVFEADSGETTDAFRGEFTVPENRSDPKSRDIKVHYVRFPSTSENPGSPIVYLAGGPGGSGVRTAQWRRFPLFMAMREFGDVIALDQRGTGASDDTPECVSSVHIPDDRIVARDEAIDLLSQSARECDQIWQTQGVDLRGYTTAESARDLDALRVHLGSEKITLWGISYGTHLALAAVAEMGPHIEKLVLASAEGLNQTVKLPSETDKYFDRIQAVIDTDPAAKAIYPDVKGLMRRVHARLDAEPVMLSLKGEGDEPADFLLHGQIMQLFSSAMISEPERVGMLLQLYLAADNSVYEPIVQLAQRFITPGAPEKWRAMPLAMDVASGITNDRLMRVNREAQTALLGDLLNFPMPHLAGAIDGLDLGDEFRTAALNSDIPAILLTGTLDGRTYPDEQRDAVAGLREVTFVTVENAGHNLFMSSPDVTDVIQRFMRGEQMKDQTIMLATPSFLPQER